MEIFRPLHQELVARWEILRAPKAGWEKKFFAAAELFCFPVSFLTIFVLLPLTTSARHLGYDLPAWLVNWAEPILLSAAVGYLTNWLAIKMLFHPYEPISWIPFWKQGLVPRNRAEIARACGQQVGTLLLQPEALANEICEELSHFLANPVFLRTTTDRLQEFLQTHEGDFVKFLLPLAEKNLEDTLESVITPANLQRLWDQEFQPLLQKPEFRANTAKLLMTAFRECAPQLSSVIYRNMEEYLQEHLTWVLRPAIPLVLAYITPETIQHQVEIALAKEENQELLREKIGQFGEFLQKWLQSPEGQLKLREVSSYSKGRLAERLQLYLRGLLPEVVHQATASPALWNWLEQEGLPSLRTQIISFVQENRETIIERLNIAQRIENAINQQDIRQFHRMVDHVAAQHLGAIQVLGYFLGALIGFFNLFH
ncbi:MAG: DUF445 family protein [Victivallales bacterium]|nr:DUF445 family protein [Victivallales bacterium]